MTVSEILRRRTLERDGALGQSPGGAAASGAPSPEEAPAELAGPPVPPPPPAPKRREPIAARRRAPDAPLPYLEEEPVAPVTAAELAATPVVVEKVPWYKLDSKNAKKKREAQAQQAQQAEAIARRPSPAAARRQAAHLAERPEGSEPPPFVRALPPLNDPETFAARSKRAGRGVPRRRRRAKS